MMQIVSQELCTCTPTMPIVDCEVRTRRPRLQHSVLGLDYIENDADSVLVVAADQALIGISCIGANNPTPFMTALGHFVVRDHDSHAWS